MIYRIAVCDDRRTGPCGGAMCQKRALIRRGRLPCVDGSVGVRRLPDGTFRLRMTICLGRGSYTARIVLPA